MQNLSLISGGGAVMGRRRKAFRSILYYEGLGSLGRAGSRRYFGASGIYMWLGKTGAKLGRVPGDVSQHFALISSFVKSLGRGRGHLGPFSYHS